MQAEEFMQEFLGERVRLQEKLAEDALPVYRRFFKAGYNPHPPAVAIEQAKAETLISVNRKTSSTEVVTTGSGNVIRTRYTLIPQDGSFVISLVEWECFSCRSEKPRPNCRYCAGTGWQPLPFETASSE